MTTAEWKPAFIECVVRYVSLFTIDSVLVVKNSITDYLFFNLFTRDSYGQKKQVKDFTLSSLNFANQAVRNCLRVFRENSLSQNWPKFAKFAKINPHENKSTQLKWLHEKLRFSPFMANKYG